MLKENDTLELKRQVLKDFCKEVVAFANTSGGRILVGIDDDGSVVGVEDADAVMLQIGNMITSNICPEIRAFVHVKAIEVEGHTVVEVDVEEGDRKPYCIAQKGFVPAGVYIRVGTGVSHASQDLIREMIKASDGDSFESCRSGRQDLTFGKVKEIFRANGLELEKEHMRTLGLVNPDGYYTNLALLLSDECEHTVKCAVFDDQMGTVLQSRKEFSGSLLKQLEEALEFIGLNNRLRSSFEGVVRKDRFDYPSAAIREALVNSIVHRKYDYPDSTIINIFSDRIEFVSLGGLTGGITIEDVMNGVSATRNPKLAAVFYRLNLIESYGIGIRVIRGLYAKSLVKPQFKASPESFVAVLPNMGAAETEKAGGLKDSRYCAECDAIRQGEAAETVEENLQKPAEGATLTERIMGYAGTHDSFTRQDIENCLSIGKDAALRQLEALARNGKLRRTGVGRGTRYMACENGVL